MDIQRNNLLPLITEITSRCPQPGCSPSAMWWLL